MKELGLSYLLLLIETFGLYMFLDVFLERRRMPGWKSVVLFAVQCFCVYWVSFFFNLYNGLWFIFPLKFLGTVMVHCLIIEIKYDGNFWKKLFWISCFLAAVLLLDSVGMVGVYSKNSEILDSFAGMAVFTLTVKVIELFIAVAVNRIMGKRERNYEMNRKIWLQFIWFPAFSILAVAFIIVEDSWLRPSAFIIIFGLLFSNFLLFFLLDGYARKERENHELMIRQERIRYQEELYNGVKNSYFEQRARAHEVQEYLKEILRLLKENQVHEAVVHAETVSEQIENRRKFYNTSNEILDSLFNEKYRQAKREGIVLSLKLTDLTKLDLTEEQLGGIFVTVLDTLFRDCRRMNRNYAKFGVKREETEWQISLGITDKETPFSEKDCIMWERNMEQMEFVHIPEGWTIERFSSCGERYLSYFIIFSKK